MAVLDATRLDDEQLKELVKILLEQDDLSFLNHVRQRGFRVEQSTVDFLRSAHASNSIFTARHVKSQRNLCSLKAVHGTTSESNALRFRSMRGLRRRTLGHMSGTPGDHTNATCAASIGETCISSRAISHDAKDLVVRGIQDHVTESSWKLRRASRPR
jgi:hypothetical protein